jgi:hypothetical protein
MIYEKDEMILGTAIISNGVLKRNSLLSPGVFRFVCGSYRDG